MAVLELKYRADKRATLNRFSGGCHLPGLTIVPTVGLSPGTPDRCNLVRVGKEAIHIRPFLNGSTQGPWPKDFSGFRADLALWLCIRFLRKEAMSQVVLWSVVTGAW